MTIAPAVAATLPSWPGRVRLLRLVTVAVAGVAVLADLFVAVADQASGLVYVALASSLAGTLLALRRDGVRAEPVSAVVLTLGGCWGATALGWDPTTSWSVVVFTLFAVILGGLPPFRSGLVVAAVLYLLVARAAGSGSVAAVAAATTAVAAAGISGGLRAQARYWHILQQQSADAAAQAVVAERLRIARDLHDLVGHEVATLNVHIGVAEVSLPAGAEASSAALAQARTAVQSVLRETQLILDILRHTDTDPADTDAPAEVAARPTPDAAQLPELIDSYRRAGLRVEAELPPTNPYPDEPSLGLTLYRVTQEALTNVSRYSDGSADLVLEATPTALTVTVTNRRSEHPHPSPQRAGYGLAGMQERVDAVGGHLEITSDDTTFRLRATLPMTPRSRQTTARS